VTTAESDAQTATRAPLVNQDEIDSVRTSLDEGHPREVISWALRRFEAGRRVVVTGLQAEGVAVADMAIALEPSVRVLTIDTGRLPVETLAYLDTLRLHWGRDIEVVHPDPADIAELDAEHGPTPFFVSPQLRLDCCHVRKVAPLERALHDVDCWMSGLRRGQSARRSVTATVELDARHRGIVKLNPLATWTDAEVSGYLRDRGVPEHPLYAQGYRSIGCAPCTRPVAAHEDDRAGRWWWETGVEKECGIHASAQEIALGIAS
jgi:phosphoadenosine phosphosulfate reductase